jgi:hypothetical protein
VGTGLGGRRCTQVTIGKEIYWWGRRVREMGEKCRTNTFVRRDVDAVGAALSVTSP